MFFDYSSWFIFPAIGSYRSLRIGNRYFTRYSGISLWSGITTAFFTIKAQLRIISTRIDENLDTRWEPLYEAGYNTPEGEAVLPYHYHPKRRFVNVVVENTGKALAKNCEVKLQLLDRTEGCQWLSDEDKPLTWDDGTNKITIRAKGGKARFHLAFSQENLTTDHIRHIDPVYCGVVK
jgi:hypothetical protein